MKINKMTIVEAVAAILIVTAGLYAYLVSPNFMDHTWGLSFALAVVLLIQSITRELEARYIAGALFSVVFLSWNFIAGTGMRDFYIASLGMTYHGIVIRTTLALLTAVFLLFLRSGNRDLKILSGSILFFQILGAVWAVKTF